MEKQKDKISSILVHLSNITDITELIRKMLTRETVNLENNSMFIHLIEGMKSSCESITKAFLNQGSEKGDNNSSFLSFQSSKKNTKDKSDFSIFSELGEEVTTVKSEISELNSKIEKIEKGYDENTSIVKNLNIISEVISENFVQIRTDYRKMFEVEKNPEISTFKSMVSKSIQTKFVAKESKSTSTTKFDLLAFNFSNLRPKFVLSQYPKSQHFIDKLTVIGVKSKGEYLIAQDSNGFGMVDFDDVFSQTNGKKIN